MKGFLEHWTGTVSIGDVSWNASPASQKNASGVDTISTNATITATVDIINPDGYPLDGGIGSAADAIRSVRISGAAGSAALAKASVISSSSTSMEIEIAPLSMIPTQESLGLEHTNFTVEFAPTRSDNALQSSAHRSLTLRYNTPPRMPLEVVYNNATSQLDWMGPDGWELVQGSGSALDGQLFWAYPSGITDSTHPDCVEKFEVYENGSLVATYTPTECLVSNKNGLENFVPQHWKGAGYDIFSAPGSSGTEMSVYAVDSEGVRSLATTSGRAPHAITLDAGDGSFPTGNEVTVYKAEGATLNGSDLSEPSRSGYALTGWFINGQEVSFPYTVSSVVTMVAKWEVVDYTIKYNLQGGVNPAGTVNVFKIYELPVDLPVPTRTGYIFGGWYDNASFSGTAVTKVESIGNKEYWAKWDAVDYTVKYNLNGGDNPAGTVGGYKVEDLPLSLPVPTRTGYVFGGWYDNASFSGTAVTKVESIGNKEYWAKWDVVDYIIKYNLDGGTNPAGTVGGYKVEDLPLSLPVPTRTGYIFVGWYDNASFSGTAVTKIESLGNKEYWAKWDANSISSITAAAPIYSDIAGLGTYRIDGGNLVFSAPSGYSAYSWYLDGSTTAAASTPEYSLGVEQLSIGTHRVTIVVTDDVGRQYAGGYEIEVYGIGYYLAGGDWQNETARQTAPDKYVSGMTLLLPDQASITRMNYTFGGWYEDISTTGNPVDQLEAGATGGKVFYAKWNGSQYEVTLNDDSTDATGGAGKVTMTYGESLPDVSVPSRPGYTFLGYFATSNDGAVQYYDENGKGMRLWKDSTLSSLRAMWEVNSYTVSLSAADASIPGDAQVNVAFGEFPPPVLIPSRDGFKFAGYFTAINGTGDQYYDGNGKGIKVWAESQENVVLYAHWNQQ